jgi:Xaa-Pro dipeptidase
MRVVSGLSRRSVLAAGPGLAAASWAGRVLGADTSKLQSLTRDARPITAEERKGRIANLQGLLRRRGMAAMIIEAGSSLDYFTGVQWRRSERTTAAVIPVEGPVTLVTPVFEEPSVRETLQVEGDVHPWNEDESPFRLLADACQPHLGSPARPIAFEGTTRLFIVSEVKRALGGADSIAGQNLVDACRMFKSPAELALLQTANDVTIAALRHVHGTLAAGMSSREVSAIMDAATVALGGQGVEFTLTLLNEASAYPHGSRQPQTIREGSTVLMDVGCNVHGYQSDITRTWVFGEPSAKQRKVWATVKRGQELALETAKPGVPCGRVDDVVRAYYEKEGWGPAYRLPGLPHRTGHGIGLDGHEAPYLVHGDETRLAAGMCFSDERGLYIPGEFGIRLEDCWHMTPAGPKLFTGLAKSIEDPI